MIFILVVKLGQMNYFQVSKGFYSSSLDIEVL